ncbi:MAG: TonB-dependent receptor, partial [Candidatus Omnitrophica bacterium]|nr:TonB-dependent receptor [Candidatus Omnitrophota bacterium]
TAIEGGSDFLDYYADFSQSSTDGFRTNNALETVDATASVIIKPAPYLRIRSEGGYHKDWYGLPGALSPANIGTLGRGGSTSPDNRGRTEDYYVMAGPDAEYASSKGKVKFSGDVIVRGRRLASTFYYTGGDTKRNDHTNTFGFTPKISIENDILAMANKLLAGIDYYAYRDAVSDASGGARTEVIIEKRTIGTYAEDTLNITPELSVNGGGRIEWAYFKFDQEEGTKSLTRKEMTEFALEAGVNYKYAERSSVYANYSRSFRFPAVDEWFSGDYVYAGTLIPGQGLNMDLVPQTGNHFEVGVKEGLLKYFKVNIDYFFDYIKHELFFNPLTYANSVYDTTVRNGMELEAHLCPMDNIDAFARYTYQKAFFVGGPFAGNDIPGIARDKIACGINYTFRDCFRIDYLANIVGPQYFISDQSNSMPKLKTYTTHDLKFSYYKYGLRGYIAIYNLLDEKYSSYGALYGTTPYYFTSPGRNVTLGVEYKF